MAEDKRNSGSSFFGAAKTAGTALAKSGIFGGGGSAAAGIAGGSAFVPVALVVMAIFILIVTTSNAAILFDSEPTKIEYIIHALERGFVKRKKDASSMISRYVASKWNC